MDDHHFGVRLLSLESAARHTGLAAATLRRAAERGELAVTPIGRRRFTTIEALREFATPRRLTEPSAG